MSASSWNGVVVLILVLFTCAEEPCRGNETNDVLAEKRLVEDLGGNFNWVRYILRFNIILWYIYGGTKH